MAVPMLLVAGQLFSQQRRVQNGNLLPKHAADTANDAKKPKFDWRRCCLPFSTCCNSADGTEQGPDLWTRITDRMPFLKDRQRLVTVGAVLLLIILCVLVTVGGYYLRVYCTYDKPRYHKKFNVRGDCIKAIDNELCRNLLKQILLERYPPKHDSEAVLVQYHIDYWLAYKEEYSEIKDDLYNMNPNLVLPLVIVAYYLSFLLVGVYCIRPLLEVMCKLWLVTLFLFFFFFCFYLGIDHNCPVSIPRYSDPHC